jgi:hypothetical protein
LCDVRGDGADWESAPLILAITSLFFPAMPEYSFSLRGKVPSSQQMQETEVFGERGASGFNKQSNAKLHCGKLAGPGFTIGVEGLSLWDGHKEVPIILLWYPTTNNMQRGIHRYRITTL